MGLLELVQGFGLDVRKISHCKGGEYHSACPNCGEGVDRFIVWPELNRYWCRRCGANGDAIQFCRNFMKMSFKEACDKTNETHHLVKHWEPNFPNQKNLVIAVEPVKTWKDKAKAFVEWSHKQLLRSPIALEDLWKRGLNKNTVNEFKLGYCINPFIKIPSDLYRDREDWGLPPEYKANGKTKKLWLPTGLVIPTVSTDANVLKLKIRRQQWHKEDLLPKYVEVSGSMRCPSIYGETKLDVVMVVESEMDAILIQQEASDICFCMALGGATKKPDLQSDHLLREARLILWCLDNDEAGKNAALWWRKTYSHLKFWPAPISKSPGDAFKDHGLDLHAWIKEGISKALRSQ